VVTPGALDPGTSRALMLGIDLKDLAMDIFDTLLSAALAATIFLTTVAAVVHTLAAPLI
jgi:hypothetical protein